MLQPSTVFGRLASGSEIYGGASRGRLRRAVAASHAAVLLPWAAQVRPSLPALLGFSSWHFGEAWS